MFKEFKEMFFKCFLEMFTVFSETVPPVNSDLLEG